MAITFFGVSSVPADGGSNTTTFDITPPINMVTGDLVFLYYIERSALANPILSSDGGQTWSFFGDRGNLVTNLTQSTWVCTFNGSWSSLVTLTPESTGNMSGIMLVFRPQAIFKSWNEIGNSFEIATVSPVVIPESPMISRKNALRVVAMATADDNTWSLSGTGWSNSGLSSQYRNLATQDTSITFAYSIFTGETTRNAISQTQVTLGTDDSLVSIFDYMEIVAPINNQAFFSD